MKYYVKAAVEVFALMTLGGLTSAAVLFLYNYFQPTTNTIIEIFLAGVGLYVLHTFISIKASMMRSLDRLQDLNNK